MITVPAAVLLLAMAACGDDGTGGATGSASGGAGAAAGACLAGAEDCDDIPTGTGGPQSGPDGSVDVAAAVEAGIQGPFLISGYYLKDPSGERLCATLRESFPPQCGEPSLPLRLTREADRQVTTEGDVEWTESPATFEGEIVDGTFVER